MVYVRNKPMVAVSLFRLQSTGDRVLGFNLDPDCAKNICNKPMVAVRRFTQCVLVISDCACCTFTLRDAFLQPNIWRLVCHMPHKPVAAACSKFLGGTLSLCCEHRSFSRYG